MTENQEITSRIFFLILRLIFLHQSAMKSLLTIVTRRTHNTGREINKEADNGRNRDRIREPGRKRDNQVEKERMRERI